MPQQAQKKRFCLCLCQRQCLCLSLSLSIFPFLSLSLCLFFNLCFSVYSSVHRRFTCLLKSVELVNPGICLCLSVSLRVCVSLCLSVSLCVCVCLSVSVSLCVCQCLCVSLCLSVSLCDACVRPVFGWASQCLPVSLCLNLFVWDLFVKLCWGLSLSVGSAYWGLSVLVCLPARPFLFCPAALVVSPFLAVRPASWCFLRGAILGPACFWDSPGTHGAWAPGKRLERGGLVPSFSGTLTVYFVSQRVAGTLGRLASRAVCLGRGRFICPLRPFFSHARFVLPRPRFFWPSRPATELDCMTRADAMPPPTLTDQYAKQCQREILPPYNPYVLGVCLAEGKCCALSNFLDVFLETAPCFFQSSAPLRRFLGGFSGTNFGWPVGLWGEPWFLFGRRGKCCAFLGTLVLENAPLFFPDSSALLRYFLGRIFWNELWLTGRGVRGGYFGPENPVFFCPRTRRLKFTPS